MHLLRRVVLAPPKDIGFRTFGVAKLMNLRLSGGQYMQMLLFEVLPTYHGSIRDETDERILWKKTKAHHQRLLQSREAILLLAGINDIQKDGRGRRGS